MSRLNPPPFSRRPLRPGILKRARIEIAAVQTGSPSSPRQRIGNARQPFRRVLRGLTMPNIQFQSNATGNGGLCRVEPDGES